LAKKITKKAQKKHRRIGYGLLVAVAVVLPLLAYFLRGVGNCIEVEPSKPNAKYQCLKLLHIQSDKELKQGLSGRNHLPQNSGMLFDFGVSDRRCMWMKDMNFSLDMLWLDETGLVTKMTDHVSPDTFPGSYCGEAVYVVELNAGVAREAGISVGSRLKL
jgi:uncharacterized membrane protein (UPF0127 family)